MTLKTIAPIIGCWVGFFVSAVAVAADRTDDAQKYWPQWRGPLATGFAPHANPPVEWSETKNIRWKVEIPGKGNAAPIIWGDRVYILTAVKTDRMPEGAEAAPDEKKEDEKPEANAEENRRPRGEGREGRAGREGRRGREGREGRRGRGGRGRGWGGRGREKPTNIYEFSILALDRQSGKIVWQQKACEAVPHESGHRTGSLASASPVTDGEILLAHFGSRGLYAYDMNGKQIWSRDFGEMTTRNSFGEGSSPAIHGDTVVVNWDHEGQSFIIALDKNTGKTKWKKDRDEVTSWSTPIIVDQGIKPQVIVNASGRVRGYDLTTGEVVWSCGGQTANAIPSPVFGGGMVYAMSGFRGSACRAIRLTEASGDITDRPPDKRLSGDSPAAPIGWSYDKDTPYVPSPLLYDDTLYFLKGSKGILTCLDAKTGEPHYTATRVDGIEGIYAGPVGAAGRVYIASRNGSTAVLKHGPKFEVLGVNALDDEFSAGPALVDGEIYLRGAKHLYCIAKE